MFKAGYFGCLLEDCSAWREIHTWCKTNLKQYSWNGNLFWFETETETDRTNFMKIFNTHIFTGLGT